MRKSPVVESSGQAIVELVLAIALAGLFLSTFVLGIIYVREAFNHSKLSVEAKLLLQKEVEAVRSIKETNWNSFLTPGIYHVVQSGNAWTVAAGTGVDNNVTHGFTVANVCRLQATSLPIGCATPGSVSDPATKKITVSASWSFFGNESITSSLYLTRNFNNTAVTQTTQADFNSGTKINTAVTNTFGGEVQLSNSAGGDWQNPQVVAVRKVGGNAAANDVFVTNNKAYIVTNSQSGFDFFIYNVTDPANPVLLGGYDLGGTGYKVVVSGNYAYIASSNNSRELTILNIANPAFPVFAGAFNAPTGADGRSVDVVGSTAYLTTDNNTTGVGYEFYTINIANPGSPIQIGGLNLNASTRDVQVIGNYAYVASTSNTQELQVVNISNPQAPILTGTFNVTANGGMVDANSVFISGNNAYLTTAQLNILDITNPSAISPTGSLNAGGTPFGVFVSGNYAFLANSQTGSEFKVVDITSPASPSLYGSVSLGGRGNGVFVVGDYAYLATANASGQFQIVLGGSGGNLAQFGTFESASIPTSQISAFNYFSFTPVTPPATTLRFQIATNSNNLTWNYVGPDGTNATFFAANGPINLLQVTGRYFRYKAYLTGDGSVTPILNDATINYSP